MTDDRDPPCGTTTVGPMSYREILKSFPPATKARLRRLREWFR